MAGRIADVVVPVHVGGEQVTAAHFFLLTALRARRFCCGAPQAEPRGTPCLRIQVFQFAVLECDVDCSMCQMM